MTTEEILKKFQHLGEEQVNKWFQGLGDAEAADLAAKLNEFGKSIPLYQTDALFAARVDKAQQAIEKFEDICAEQKVTNLKHDIIIDGHLKKADESYARIRLALLAEISKDPANQKLITIAHGLIQIEKDSNSYDPKLWEGLPNLS
jgi:hypothetical protein